MKIRTATPDDTDLIIEMMRNFRKENPFDFYLDPNTPEVSTKKLIKVLFETQLGVMFLAEKDGQIAGMLLAVKDVNIWDHTISCLKEIAWWVEPNFRGSSAALKLLKAFTALGDKLKEDGDIKYYTISKMITSPDIDFSRWGFKRLEETWLV